MKQFTDNEDTLQEWNRWPFAFHFTFFEMDHYSNLWIFVSKFTSASAGKLYKIYRKAKKNMSSGALLSDGEHQVKWLSNKCDSELI